MCLPTASWQQYFQEPPRGADGARRQASLARAASSGVTRGLGRLLPLRRQRRARAQAAALRYIAEPGGSIRDDNGHRLTANKYGITMAFTGMRLFHH